MHPPQITHPYTALDRAHPGERLLSYVFRSKVSPALGACQVMTSPEATRRLVSLLMHKGFRVCSLSSLVAIVLQLSRITKIGQEANLSPRKQMFASQAD